jgi:hypothetical protein
MDWGMEERKELEKAEEKKIEKVEEKIYRRWRKRYIEGGGKGDGTG